MITEKKPEDLFAGMVGQAEMKRKLAFHLENYKTSNILPSLCFIGSKGFGKTMIARELARHLTIKGESKPKNLVEINATTLKTVKTFFDSVVIPYLSGSDATVFIDEAHEMGEEVQNALLTILETREDCVTRYNYDNSTYVFDLRRLSFIFATTDAQNLIEPLQDRLTPIDFEEYTKTDLIEILQKHLNKNKIEVDLEAITRAASVLRGNPRSAQKMANNIKDYLNRNNNPLFNTQVWNEISKALSIKPLGLNATEISVLRVLKQNSACSLTKLSAALGLTRECLQKHYELYLLKHRLIEIGKGSGRALTTEGKTYLEDLQKEGLTS